MRGGRGGEMVGGGRGWRMEESVRLARAWPVGRGGLGRREEFSSRIAVGMYKEEGRELTSPRAGRLLLKGENITLIQAADLPVA